MHFWCTLVFGSGMIQEAMTSRGLWLLQAACLGGRRLGFLRSEAPRPGSALRAARAQPEGPRRAGGRRMARRGWGRIPGPRVAVFPEAAAEDDAFLPGPSVVSGFFSSTPPTPYRRLRLFRGSVQDWGRQAWAG